MKNTNKIRLAASIALAALLGACSQQTTSIQHVNKLDNAQYLTNVKVSPVVKECEIPSQMVLNQKEAEAVPVITPVYRATELQVAPVKKAVNHGLVETFTKKAEKVILKQTAAVRHLGTNHAIASTSSPKDGGGLLGLAITCLIVGIVLFFLGFASLGALFWTIGIIVLVVAIIFFILWLVGRAVSN